MLFVVLLVQPILIFLRFLSELWTRTEQTDGRTSNSFIRMQNNKVIRHFLCILKEVVTVIAIQKANEYGCRFSDVRAPIATWPVAGRSQSSAGVNFHSALKRSNIVRLLWEWFLDHIRPHTSSNRHDKEFYTCEGSAPPVGVGRVGSMACAGNAIRGASPNRKNPEAFQAGRISALRAESEWAAK